MFHQTPACLDNYVGDIHQQQRCLMQGNDQDDGNYREGRSDSTEFYTKPQFSEFRIPEIAHDPENVCEADCKIEEDEKTINDLAQCAVASSAPGLPQKVCVRVHAQDDKKN